MARQRFIHPEIWTDPTLGQLSPVERLFFIGCFSNADDEGRLLGSPAYLRATIFPYDDLSLDEVKAMRDRVVAICKNLVLYEVDGLEYLAFAKWSKYQKPKYPKPSKLPPPPQASEQPKNGQEEQQEQSRNGETFLQDGRKDGETLEKDFRHGMGLGRDGFEMGMGREGEGGLGGTQTNSPSGQKPDSPSGGKLQEKHKTAQEGQTLTEAADITAQERVLLHQLKSIPGYPFDYSRDVKFIRALAVDFPDLDLLEEAKRWGTRILDKPFKANANPRLQFRHWCEIAVKRRRGEAQCQFMTRGSGSNGATARNGPKDLGAEDYIRSYREAGWDIPERDPPVSGNGV